MKQQPKTMVLPNLHNVLMTFISLQSGYKWGGKVKPLSDPKPLGVGMDCSGAFRWIVYHASGGTVTVPDGSTAQREYLQANGYERVSYSQACNDNSGTAYACFSWGSGAKERHVWLVRQRASWESWGGHGPGVRSPKSLWHRLNCRAAFRIT